MNNDLNKIKSFVSKIFRRTDFSGLSIFGQGQHFDWKVLLAFFLLIIIIAVSFSVHVFLGVKAGDIFKDDFKPPVRNSTINREVLDGVIKDFNDRADKTRSLQVQKPIFVDPSL